MKIALCLSGGLRNFKDTQYSFQEYLLSTHDVDVFFYGLENRDGSEINRQDLEQLYHPKISVVNNQQYYDSIPCPYHLPSAYYAFYNIYMCNELKKQYEIKNGFKYDLVIRSRTDCFWFRYIREQEFELAKHNIMIPADWAFKGVNPYARSDMFAFGNSELMDSYSLMFTRLKEYTDTIGMFHPESICGYHLLLNNIPNIENERCFVFEYPSRRTEKYIHPYKHIKHFDEPDIKNEELFLKTVTDKRKTF
jgi:hypothetical protein